MVLWRANGPMDMRNSHRFRSRQACATSSKSALSKIQIPMAVMLTWCIDIAALTYWAGPTSLPVSDPSMAISRLWNSGKQSAWLAVEPTLTTDTLFLLPSAISVSGIQSWTEKLANVD